MVAENEQPSEAHVQEAMAEAGQGANDAPAADLTAETPVNGGVNGVTEPGVDHDVSSKSSEVADEAADEPKKPAEEPKTLEQKGKGKIAIIMLALCMAVFLAALDMTIVSTALPTIALEFNISNSDYVWVGSGYSLACAASTPAWGKISDIFGRKPILLVANITFLVGSLIAGVSININMLLAGRCIQGVGGGGLLSLVNICIGDLFSMRSRGMYYGFVGMTWAFAGAIGPVLGGAFAEYVTWRWCFYVNLPCDGAAFLVLLFFLDIETPKTPIVDGLLAIDWLGLLLVVGGVVMFLLGLGFGGVSYPWDSAVVLCLIIFGLVVLALFFVVEWKVAKYPMMPLRLFTNLTSVASFGVTFCHGMVFISGSYFLPIYFQAVLSATPLLSGVYQFPYILSLSFMSATTGIFIRKTGRYQEAIWFGFFLMTLGFGLFIDLPNHANWAPIAIFQIIAGIGTGPNFQAPLIALQSHTRPQDMATATATFAFVRQLAAAISIVIGGVIFQNRIGTYLPELLAALPHDPSTAYSLADGAAGANVQLIRTLPVSAQVVIKNIYTESLKDMWIFYAVIAFVGLIVSLFIRKAVLSKQHEVRKQGLDVQERERQEALAEKRAKKEGAMANGANGALNAEKV